MTECCFLASPKQGYKLTGIACCCISFLSLGTLLFTGDSLSQLFGVASIIAYGVPSYFWYVSLSDPDPKYKRRFAKTFIWMTNILWLLTILFFALIILAFASWGSDVSFGTQARIFFVAAVLSLVYFLPSYFLVYKSLIAFAEQVPE